MSQTSRVAFIGCGNMGTAIVKGLRLAYPDMYILAVAPSTTRRSMLEDQYQCVTFESTHALIDGLDKLGGLDVIVLAVKPQVMPQVMDEVRELVLHTNALCVSVAAGLDLAFYLDRLPEGARVIRTMPNTPLAYGAGTTLLCASEGATDADRARAEMLFANTGQVFWISEDEFDAASALSGCAPAYVARVIEALSHAGVAEGLSPELSSALARDAICGSGLMIREDSRSVEDIRVSICSPGGTTLAALAALDEAGLVSAFDQAIHAASLRSKELRS